jgi:uncharacterized protein
VPGQYITINRVWTRGDTVAIVMPMSFRAERTIDDRAVQSLYYGPTLLTVQAPPVVAATGQAAAGQSAAAVLPTAPAGGAAPVSPASLETGLLKLSLYPHFALSGDFASMLTPVTGKPLHFSANGLTFAPLFVADPQPGATQPYHMYVRRHEPTIAFAGVETGIANTARDDGTTVLDAVWSSAPFATSAQFVRRVEAVTGEWRAAGKLSAADAATISQSARRAARNFRTG